MFGYCAVCGSTSEVRSDGEEYCTNKKCIFNHFSMDTQARLDSPYMVADTLTPEDEEEDQEN